MSAAVAADATPIRTKAAECQAYEAAGPPSAEHEEEHAERLVQVGVELVVLRLAGTDPVLEAGAQLVAVSFSATIERRCRTRKSRTKVGDGEIPPWPLVENNPLRHIHYSEPSSETLPRMSSVPHHELAHDEVVVLRLERDAGEHAWVHVRDAETVPCVHLVRAALRAALAGLLLGPLLVVEHRHVEVRDERLAGSVVQRAERQVEDRRLPDVPPPRRERLRRRPRPDALPAVHERVRHHRVVELVVRAHVVVGVHVLDVVVRAQAGVLSKRRLARVLRDERDLV